MPQPLVIKSESSCRRPRTMSSSSSRSVSTTLLFVLSMAVLVSIEARGVPHNPRKLTWKPSSMGNLEDSVLSSSSSSLWTPTTSRTQQEQPEQLLPRRQRQGLEGMLPTTLRGGAVFDDDDDDDEFDDDDDDDDALLFDLDEDELAGSADDVNEGLFSEDTTVDRLVEAWKKTPPFTQAFFRAAALATLAGFLTNKNEFPAVLQLDFEKVLTRFQVWRVFTAFLNMGPLGITLLLSGHFMWTYMSSLERLCHNKPYDYWIMVIFGQLSMVSCYPALNLSPKFLGSNLGTYLVYIWSRYHEGLEVNLFGLPGMNVRAEQMPWVFAAQSFLLEGELPILDGLGIVFGHVYYHLKSIGLLRAPAGVVEWYHHSPSPLATQLRQHYRTISSDFEMI